MNERIMELRKALNLTLEKFGNYLGVTKVAISNIEKGNRTVTNQMFKAICHVCWNGKFVNEEWLRTGVGEMFLELPEEDKIAGYVSDILENKDNPLFKIIVEVMKTYNQLTSDNQKVLLAYAQQLLENLKKED